MEKPAVVKEKPSSENKERILLSPTMELERDAVEVVRMERR